MKTILYRIAIAAVTFMAIAAAVRAEAQTQAPPSIPVTLPAKLEKPPSERPVSARAKSRRSASSIWSPGAMSTGAS